MKKDRFIFFTISKGESITTWRSNTDRPLDDIINDVQKYIDEDWDISISLYLEGKEVVIK